MLQTDSIYISDVSISPVNFKLISNGTTIPSSDYEINFETALLVIDSKRYSDIKVEYTAYPDFLTETYAPMSQQVIVPSSNNSEYLYRYAPEKDEGKAPFEGLYTQGSLARGITVGNNQDAVTNSSLDLQISGKLSKDVTIKASISDSNIPIQKNGYSQQIEEFDRIFIELFTNQWSLKAGDINLKNNETNFLKFDKKVAGLSVDVTPTKVDSENHFKASGALVRGRFTRHLFTGIDGNQGPYKLLGPNGETYIVILSGSETIYVNGRPLKRGDQNDYTIDYNTAEITFTTTFPVTANMRITAEFQYSDRNYTRFVSYNKASHKSEKLEIGGYFYTESDAKNQPLQQNLSEDQKKTLAEAGNDTAKMISESGFETEYDENKILYKKILINSTEVYEFSQNPDDTLYSVTFSYIGENQGSYQLENTTAVGRIFSYTGTNMGDYAPVIQLVAPTRLQVAVAKANYSPTSKTILKSEIALSDNNQNLFSDLDNENNQGIAAKAGWSQIYTDKKWLVKSNIDFDYLQQNFTSIQRIYNVEFNRDWNLVNRTGTQEFLQSELLISNKKNSEFSYKFESLKFQNSFTGHKHKFRGGIRTKNTTINAKASLLENEGTTQKGSFLKAAALFKQYFKKTWIGGILDTENNEQTNISTQKLDLTSQKYFSYGAFFGVGDSTKVYAKIGVDFRENDSVKNEALTRVNNSKSYYINSRLVQQKNAQVGAYINYRTVDNVFQEDTNMLNSRLNYTQRLFKNFISWNSIYETSSGTSPQQQFAYVKTEPGQGFYTWIDYNGNGIQEFEEFEIAKFADQADYLRVTLPTVNYIRVNQTKFSQSFNITPNQWRNKVDFRKTLSQFSNQSFVLIDTKKQRSGNGFDLNPFDTENPSVIGLLQTIKNSFFFRRGLQNYSTTYIYSNSRTKTNLGIGFQENKQLLRQLNFQHRLGTFWLFDAKLSKKETDSKSENYSERNYVISSQEANPIITYSFSVNSNFSFAYEYKDKEEPSSISALELHKIGTSYQYAHPTKGAIIADFNLYKNNFTGVENSPIAYEMLEGLQPGDNFVWNLIAQKKLTSYLHLNLNYTGRKSETANTIHTGSVQLRAVF
ncbi:hypothetical protein [Flavicella sp.]|uniref:hypothetical protein n=1 Tax=Flavicella sp. TaxID=2957742 RepID=UPI002616C01B|nr:hypothetical protein [Flavicella sp.]MDG1804566.1 hypothetical protein [Flavicella sp.]MDG2279544.1 hypothetical protein [Flavicella sp.]